jgi:hypothetical protein
MSVNQEFEKTGSIAYLCDEYLKNNFIDPEASERLGVKRGLRNPDGTGVLAGLTKRLRRCWLRPCGRQTVPTTASSSTGH